MKTTLSRIPEIAKETAKSLKITQEVVTEKPARRITAHCPQGQTPGPWTFNTYSESLARRAGL